MNPRLARWTVPLMVGAALLLGQAMAAACTLDNVASASLNGTLAVRNKAYPKTPAQLKLYAPFIFVHTLSVRRTERFAENRREVAKSLTAAAMRKSAQWRFGDGTHRSGWSVMHSFRVPGTYLISVWARGPSHKWYEFDAVNVRVRK